MLNHLLILLWMLPLTPHPFPQGFSIVSPVLLQTLCPFATFPLAGPLSLLLGRLYRFLTSAVLAPMFLFSLSIYISSTDLVES